MSRVRIHNFSISLDGFATGEGLRQPAVDRFTAVGTDDDAELELCHGTLYLSVSYRLIPRVNR